MRSSALKQYRSGTQISQSRSALPVAAQNARRRFLHLAAAAAALPAVSRMARAQGYPTRPVRIIVGQTAGGGQDIFAWLIGQWLSDRLGRPFIIENRPGAGGNIGAEAVVRSSAMLESLCIPSSSVCKHWNRVVVGDATRATFSGHCRFDRFRRQVAGANLVWRAGHNLHRWQHAGFDQAAYRVACDA